MNNFVPREDIVPLLRAAMSERLAQIRPADKKLHAPLTSNLSAEEALRSIMVRFRRRLAARKLTADDLTALQTAIDVVALNVGWKDLRFIDAMNALYETWLERADDENRSYFLVSYSRALEQMLKS